MPSYDSAILVGVMSGTSLDGVTATVSRFALREGTWTVDLLGVETVPYDDALRERLGVAMTGGTAAEYTALSFELGARFADAVVAVLATAGVPRADIAAIASHGQTVWHAPPAGTWQLGEGTVIAERTGIAVIEDFRVRDVAAGGEGAPLVPIADALLFGSAEAPRALQNIGGMANVSVVPRLADMRGVRAFDTGPGVAVLDALAHLLTGERLDRDGALARSGAYIESVVATLLQDEFFRREPPRSTGRERFGTAYAVALHEACRRARPDCSAADVLATATELSVRSIADAYARFVPEPVADVLLSGGGARNGYLVERLGAALRGRDPAPAVRLFDDVFFPSEAKEAVAFAFLGLLHLRHEPGNVPGATGARGTRVLGKLIPA
jgi:anhydro-N-acetylmuramic acid kinase